MKSITNQIDTNDNNRLFRAIISKIDIESRISFISTLIIGLITYMFRISNNLPAGDGVLCSYSAENNVFSGRFLLAVFGAIDSFFDLPFFNGFLSLIFVGISSVIIIKIFNVKSYFAIINISAIIVLFPSVVEIMGSTYTSTPYFISMFFATLAVYVMRIDKINFKRVIIGCALLVMSCGIYQSYIPFALVLSLSRYIIDIFDGYFSNKQLLFYALKQFFVYTTSLIIYYIIWKLLVIIEDIPPMDYQGISNAGSFSFGMLISGLSSMKIALVDFFFESGLRQNPTLYTYLNLIFVIAFISMIIAVIIKKKIYKKPIQLIILLAAFLLIPFAICMWLFTSETLIYNVSARMLGSICVLYVLLIVVAIKYFNIRTKAVICLLMAVISFNFALQSNILSHLIERVTDNTFSKATEMVYLIREEQK